MDNLQYQLEELKKQILWLDEQREFFYIHERMLRLEYHQDNVEFWEYRRRSRYLSSEIARIDDERKSVQSEIDATCHAIEKMRTEKHTSSRSQQSSKSTSSSKRRKTFVISSSSRKSEVKQLRQEAVILKNQLDEVRKQQSALLRWYEKHKREMKTTFIQAIYSNCQ